MKIINKVGESNYTEVLDDEGNDFLKRGLILESVDISIRPDEPVRAVLNCIVDEIELLGIDYGFVKIGGTLKEYNDKFEPQKPMTWELKDKTKKEE